MFRGDALSEAERLHERARELARDIEHLAGLITDPCPSWEELDAVDREDLAKASETYSRAASNVAALARSLEELRPVSEAAWLASAGYSTSSRVARVWRDLTKPVADVIGDASASR